jgi:hypothetical protein
MPYVAIVFLEREHSGCGERHQAAAHARTHLHPVLEEAVHVGVAVLVEVGEPRQPTHLNLPLRARARYGQRPQSERRAASEGVPAA